MKPHDSPKVLGGQIEGSNVQALKEMVTMMDIQRSVESYQKIIQTLGDMDKMSTGQLGRLS